MNDLKIKEFQIFVYKNHGVPLLKNWFENKDDIDHLHRLLTYGTNKSSSLVNYVLKYHTRHCATGDDIIYDKFAKEVYPWVPRRDYRVKLDEPLYRSRPLIFY